MCHTHRQWLPPQCEHLTCSCDMIVWPRALIVIKAGQRPSVLACTSCMVCGQKDVPGWAVWACQEMMTRYGVCTPTCFAVLSTWLQCYGALSHADLHFPGSGHPTGIRCKPTYSGISCGQHSFSTPALTHHFCNCTINCPTACLHPMLLAWESREFCSSE